MAKFTAGLPEEGINVSKTHPLKELFFLLAGVLAAAALVIVLIVYATDLVAPHIPVKYEKRFFSTLQPVLAQKSEDEEDPGVKKLQALTDRLASHWSENEYDFSVGVMHTEDPNAMALPGGAILVTSGLLEEAETENEVAFVLAHEIGHFAARDHLRRVGREIIGALLLSMITGSTAAGDAASLVDLTGRMTRRGYDRKAEEAADLFALGLVEAEYGHVAQAGSFFEKLLRKEKEGGGSGWAGAPTYLATHPPTEDRLAYLKERARERGWSFKGDTVPFKWEEKTEADEEGADKESSEGESSSE